MKICRLRKVAEKMRKVALFPGQQVIGSKQIQIRFIVETQYYYTFA
jgi:hypothetical protein